MLEHGLLVVPVDSAEIGLVKMISYVDILRR